MHVEGQCRLPDVVGELTRRVPLTRATIVRTLAEINGLEQVKMNPSVFIDQVEKAIKEALYAEEGDEIRPPADRRLLERRAVQDLAIGRDHCQAGVGSRRH